MFVKSFECSAVVVAERYMRRGDVSRDIVEQQKRRESETGPSRGWGRGEGKLPRAPRGSGAPPSPINIKCTKMHYSEKEKFKNFLSRGAIRDCLVPHKIFPRAPLWLLTGLVNKVGDGQKVAIF